MSRNSIPIRVVPRKLMPSSLSLRRRLFYDLPVSMIQRASQTRELRSPSDCKEFGCSAILPRNEPPKPMKPYPEIFDFVEGLMQRFPRSLICLKATARFGAQRGKATPTPAASLSVFPSGSPAALREKRRLKRNAFPDL